MWKCKSCGEELENTFDRCWSCATGRDGSPPEAPVELDIAEIDTTTPRTERHAEFQMNVKINFIAGEEEIASIGQTGSGVTLTNKRVRGEISTWGASDTISITLQSIASCGLTTKSHPLLLILAALAVLAALFAKSLGIAFGALILGVLYFLTRKAVISIASNGGLEIAYPFGGVPKDSLLEFIEKVESAKLK